ASEKGWLSSRKERPVKKIRIRHSYASVNHIWFQANGKIQTCILSPRSQRLSDMNYFDTQHQLFREQQNLMALNENNRNLGIETHHQTQDVVEKAIAAASGLEKSHRKSIQPNIKDLQKIQGLAQQLQLDIGLSKLFSRNFTKHAMQVPGSTLDSMPEDDD